MPNHCTLSTQYVLEFDPENAAWFPIHKLAALALAVLVTGGALLVASVAARNGEAGR